MKFRDTLVHLLNAVTNLEGGEVPLFNEYESVLVSIAIRCDLVNAGLINPDASLCYEEKHPINTTQVFDEASTAELINTYGSLGHVVKVVIGDYWVFFDPVGRTRLATLNTHSMKLWA